MVKTLLPPNATEFERAVEGSVRSASNVPVRIDTLWSAKDCPAELLGYLAWSLSVDDWDSAWPEARKRDVIANAVFVHRHKGTRAAVERALLSLDLGVRLAEWFEYGGEPFRFKAEVEVSDRGLTEKEVASIARAIDLSKNARSHLESLKVYLASRADIFASVACVSGQVVTIQPYVATVPDQNVLAAMGAAVHGHNMITIGAAA